MRIGECIDLSVRLSAHTRTRPVGHPCTDRQAKNRTWVPVDSMVCQIVDRLRSFAHRRHPAPIVSYVGASRGIQRDPKTPHCATGYCQTRPESATRIVPHQFRHTYGTEMLRAGVSLAAVDETAGPQEPAHDHGVCRDHPSGPAARVSPGSRPPPPSCPSPACATRSFVQLASTPRNPQLPAIRPACHRNVPPYSSRRIQPPLLDRLYQPPHQNHRRDPQTHPS